MRGLQYMSSGIGLFTEMKLDTVKLLLQDYI